MYTCHVCVAHEHLLTVLFTAIGIEAYIGKQQKAKAKKLANTSPTVLKTASVIDQKKQA